jgi:hypothetical protein
MKTLLASLFAASLLVAVPATTAGAAVGVVVHVNDGHHGRHHVCGGWGWRNHHHDRFCRRWYWR